MATFLYRGKILEAPNLMVAISNIAQGNNGNPPQNWEIIEVNPPTPATDRNTDLVLANADQMNALDWYSDDDDDDDDD